MSKVVINRSTPDAWLPRLERKRIAYDPVHAELVGADVTGARITASAVDLAKQVGAWSLYTVGSALVWAGKSLVGTAKAL